MEIELLARAVIEIGGKFLIAHTKGASNVFLPGGHIEPGEGMRRTLVRELREELGIQIEVGEYLGAVEHSWTSGGATTHEINHVFTASAPTISIDSAPGSLEDQVEFMWLSPKELRDHNLQPAPLQELLTIWTGEPPHTWWASTILARNP